MTTGLEISPLSGLPVRRKEWLAVPLLMFASAFVLLIVYLQSNWPGTWISSAPALSWHGAALKLTKGQGYDRDQALTIEALDEQGIAIASLSPRAFPAKDYSTVNVTVPEVPPGAELVLLWRTVENPNRIFAQQLKAGKTGVAPLEIAGDENWRGQIMGLALTVKGQLDAPLTVKGVSLKPVSTREVLSKLAGRWFAADGWMGTSINFLDGDAADQDVSFVSAIAAMLALALALYAGLVKFERLRAHVAVLWCIVFVGWFALDARWQANLLRQLDATRAQFAGKSVDGKHLAADDAALYGFMQQVNAKVAPGTGRILYFSDDRYLRYKGAYYLYPRNVMASGDLIAPAMFKAGDHIVLFAKNGLKYEPSHQALEWGGIQLPVDLLLSAGGNLLLKVR